MYEFLMGRPPIYNLEIREMFKDIKFGKLKFDSSLSKEAKDLIEVNF